MTTRTSYMVGICVDEYQTGRDDWDDPIIQDGVLYIESCATGRLGDVGYFRLKRRGSDVWEQFRGTGRIYVVGNLLHFDLDPHGFQDEVRAYSGFVAVPEDSQLHLPDDLFVPDPEPLH